MILHLENFRLLFIKNYMVTEQDHDRVGVKLEAINWRALGYFS